MFRKDDIPTLVLHHDLIHIRRIHAPPYGKVEIDAGKLQSTLGFVEIKGIFQIGGVFLARVGKKTRDSAEKRKVKLIPEKAKNCELLGILQNKDPRFGIGFKN